MTESGGGSLSWGRPRLAGLAPQALALLGRPRFRPWQNDRTLPPSATYTFSSEAQSSLSIESASCCRRASSVPTSCPGREGGLLMPGRSSPAGGRGDQATAGTPRDSQDSRSRAHCVVYREGSAKHGLRAQAAPVPVATAQHFLPPMTLPRAAGSSVPGKHSTSPALNSAYGTLPSLPAQPPHQSETGT